ncbi:BRCA1-A complex subunit Abraxas 1 isoform 5-T5 [Syngnathus typhle]
MAEPSVRIPGIVLSSLLFEHINKDSDVEGLILGENHVEEHVTISDTQEDHVHLRRTSSVHKHVCCHKLDTWYDAAGRVDEEAVGRLLGANHRDLLIGWYRQRRNSERRMTMREKAVHENFRAALGVPHAIFLLVTPAALAEAGSTHRAEYSAFVSGNRQVPVVVTNLASLDHRAYWTASPPCRTPGYRRAIGRHSSTLLDASGRAADAEAVNGMNESLQDELRVSQPARRNLARAGRFSRALLSTRRLSCYVHVEGELAWSLQLPTGGGRAAPWQTASAPCRRRSPKFAPSGRSSVTASRPRPAKKAWPSQRGTCASGWPSAHSWPTRRSLARAL